MPLDTVPDDYSLKFIEVRDHAKFGRLILQWSRGDGPPANPMTMDAFKAALQSIPGVDHYNDVVYIPDDAPQEVRFVQGDENVLYLSLSPKHMIEAAIVEGAPTGQYPIADWYEMILDGVLTEFMEIFERRVGDYTIHGCR